MEKTLSKTREFEGRLLTLDVHQVELEDGSRSSREIVPVSYTHLTLPTIYSV